MSNFQPVLHRFAVSFTPFLLAMFLLALNANVTEAQEFKFGFAKTDITPKVPIRLSGYASRKSPFEGIDEKLLVRAMVFQYGNEPPSVLVSIETIGLPASVTNLIVDQVKALGFNRERIAICMTHTHTAPHVTPGLDNLFQPELSDDQKEKSKTYTARIVEQSVKAIVDAQNDLKPGKMFTASAKVGFAKNRRLLEKGGGWIGFGVNPRGPVDHSLPVIRITDASGKKTRGIVFNYACHCTTFWGKYNRVNGDWAGYAQAYLESENPGATAMCTIGCGADATPQRSSKQALSLAKSQGKQIADEIKTLISSGQWRPIATAHVATFGYAGLPSTRHSKQQLNERLEDSNPHVRRHAQVMLETLNRMGRLPETYPMPIQVWRFGDEFAMVFLGGEVVVDYALRIKKELAAASKLKPEQFWVSAYTNDVFGYVASERMRVEGGYEVDYSMIYYLLPGRWETGTEDVIIKRVKELFEAKKIAKPQPVEDALKSFILPPGFEIDAIASEPLVTDPINFSVDARGRLWVVEMGDYPQGAPSRADSPSKEPRKTPWDGQPGGRVKCLTDTNGDGKYDSATVFLDGLTFPTGAIAWRDGVIVSGAPNIFFASDTTGDGKADHREVLYSGFKKANPQHRVNGFEWGLDGWLYLSGGTNNREITCVKTGEKVRLAGRDLKIQPETGRAKPVSGDSQYGRCRDEFNHWFGNTNSEPLFQLVLDDHFLERNPYVRSPAAKHYLTNPILNPPVYPSSRTLDRFNDLHTSDRFSSACAPLVFRNRSLGVELQRSALICEPVHNLISRVELRYGDVAISGSRFESEQQQEFLSSTDNWFRPVRQMTGPDGGLWICDMYRHVIEHPEWIPESWQSNLDLYAGSDMGRIYRLKKKGQTLEAATDFTKLTNEQLVQKLKSANGWTRDMSQRILLERDATKRLSAEVVEAVVGIADDASNDSRVRIQAIWTISLVSKDAMNLTDILHDRDPQIVANTIRVFGLSDLAGQELDDETLPAWNSPLVQFELALACANLDDPRSLLLELIKANPDNDWIRAAVLSSAVGQANELLADLLGETDLNIDSNFLEGLTNTIMADRPKIGLNKIVTLLKSNMSEAPNTIAIEILDACLNCLKRNGHDLANLSKDDEVQSSLLFVQKRIEQATEVLNSSASIRTRVAAIQLVGHASLRRDEYRQPLLDCLLPSNHLELQSAAVRSLNALGDSRTLVRKIPTAGPAIQKQIQSALLQRESSTLELINAVEDKTIAPSQLTPSTIQQLLTHRNSSIRVRSGQLFGESSLGTRAKMIARYNASLETTGDPEIGREIFAKHCANCHRFKGTGQEAGPSLDTLTGKDRAYILKSILDPNAAVEWKYKSYNFITNDGRMIKGLVMQESATSVTLALLDGKRESLLLSEIEDMKNSSKSFMPDGFERSITVEQMGHLLEFLKPNTE